MVCMHKSILSALTVIRSCKMSISNQPLQISGIVSSNQGGQEDQHIQEFGSGDHEFEAEDNSNYQHPNIYAQINQANIVEPTIIPTDHNVFTLTTTAVSV